VSGALYAFADEARPAGRLARALGVPLRIVALHRFPDGEGLPRVEPCSGAALVYRSLDRPDPKLMPLLLTADALRRAGADRVTLIAPYLCYLRQDAVFRPGEALSREVACRLLAAAFDGLVTVDPHLHRTAEPDALMPGRPVRLVSAAGPLAAALGETDDTVVLGPDVESERCAAALGAALRAPHLTLRKRRQGDREVAVEPPPAAVVRGRRVVLADDICSTGETLAAVVAAARAAGARSVEVAVSHGLFAPGALARLTAAGAGRVAATDSCARVRRPVRLAGVLAAALAIDAAQGAPGANA
jgi:ribose-phosphate pyrophosphokinase